MPARVCGTRDARREEPMEAAITNCEARRERVTKEVWTIVEREGLQKAIWVKIGVAWENRDGSLKVVFNALPMKGEVLIRDPKPFEDARARPALLDT
jgi:hypothetical protein